MSRGAAARRVSRAICWRRGSHAPSVARASFVVEDRRPWGRGSRRETEEQDDQQEFGKNAQAHHLVEGPLLRVSTSLQYVLRSLSLTFNESYESLIIIYRCESASIRSCVIRDRGVFNLRRGGIRISKLL